MDKEVDQLNQLMKRFPYMFAGQQLGIDIYRGWLAEFVELCEAIDGVLGENKRGFYWRQIKEKHGSARYYFRTNAARPMRLSLSDGKSVREITTGLDGHEVEQQIAKLCHDAEVKSATKCSVCGVPAKIQNCHGWHLCVCEKHAPTERGGHHPTALVRPQIPT